MAKKFPKWMTFEGIVTKVVDGDTLECSIDLGFSIAVHEKFRLYGINTAELKAKDPKEKAKAKTAQTYLSNMLLNKTVILEVMKDKKEKYGRYLVNVIYNGKNINNELVKHGLAIEFML